MALRVWIVTKIPTIVTNLLPTPKKSLLIIIDTLLKYEDNSNFTDD